MKIRIKNRQVQKMNKQILEGEHAARQKSAKDVIIKYI